jgi:Domain of unknown function (DUF5011)/Listeria-Bacteroides repeat domain (List_Bact_rpt)
MSKDKYLFFFFIMKKLFGFLLFLFSFFWLCTVSKASTIVWFDFNDGTKTGAITNNATWITPWYTADMGIAGNINNSITITTGGATFSAWVWWVWLPSSSPNTENRDNGSGAKYWMIQFSTLWHTGLQLSSKQRSSNTGPRDFIVQYSTWWVIWFDVWLPIVVANNFTGGVVNNLSLPSVLSNQPTVYLRWIMTSNTSVSAWVVAAAWTSRIDDILVVWDPIFTLTYTAWPNGTIVWSGLQTVISWGNGTVINAVANTWYSFLNRSDGSTTNPRTDTGVTGNITVTGNFTINEYVVTFEDYDTTFISSGLVEYGSSAIAPVNPIRAWYTFSWWNTDFSFVTWTMTIVGEYIANLYDVSFDANNWTGMMNNQSFVYDTAQNLTGTMFTREWYTFSWWNDQIAWTWTRYTDAQSVNNLTTTSGGIITLYAQRTLNTYLVTFVDRDSTVLSTGMVDHGSGAIAPSDPIRTGYTFSGWNTNFSIITGDTIVTGEYTINQYTIMFDTDGGTSIPSITDDYWTGIIAPTNPTKTGYTFSGWVPTIPATMPAMDVTLTGQWTINSYTLSYTGWWADWWTAPTSQTGDYNTDITLATNTFTRVWYTFSGWDCGAAGVSYTITMDTECTAQRTLNTYLVTFVDRNSAILSTGMVNHGSGAIAPANPTRTGYTFSWWNTDFSIITGVTIITGEYTINQYSLTFNSASGSFVASMSGDYNSVIIPPTNPTRTGYAFSGWTPTLPITIPAMDTMYTAQWNDITNPVMTLNGVNSLSVIVNRVYTEQWATCVDNHDPVCTVVVSWTVNTALVWPYVITYTATDAAWNISTLTRTVNVIPWWWTASSISWSVNTTTPVNPTPNNPVDTTPTSEEWIEEEWWEEDMNIPLTESDKSRIFNPSFTQTCFDFINKQTIDQWVEVSETFLDAHQLFYSYSLTKRQWTKEYRPFDTITREEAARFFVEFAKNVLCRKPNTTYTAQFSDLADADDTLESFIKASYEFGIFHGDGGSKLPKDQPRTFRPKALMTQDELAAVIVRLVTNEYDETWWDDRSNTYKTFLKNYAKTTLQSSQRENIAEVVYDVYRWNEYVREDIGYVIKK